MKKHNLYDQYQNDIRLKLKEESGLENILSAPRLSKVIINVGAKEALTDKKALERISEQIALIAGQKPVKTQAKKSIAAFKLREGDLIGVMVTLRGRKMYDFLEKLFNIVLPRVRDFRGVSRQAFDGRGNYSLGLKEQIVFPEIDYGGIDKVRGLEINIVTTARDDNQALKLLEALGMPFKK